MTVRKLIIELLNCDLDAEARVNVNASPKYSDVGISDVNSRMGCLLEPERELVTNEDLDDETARQEGET